MALDNEAEREDSGSSDDEIRRWEREQIRKGGVREPDRATGGAQQQHQQSAIPTIAADAPATGADVIRQLRAQLQAAKAAHQVRVPLIFLLLP